MVIPQRQIIYSKDIEFIMGCSVRTAQRVIQKVRDAVGKGIGDYITVKEFCEVMRIEEREVRGFMSTCR